jgi:hypothetical protein
MYLERGDIRVHLDHDGEGWGGEYNNEDPNDEPLLRFCVLRFDGNEYQEIDSASYCTRLPDTISEEERKRALDIIMDQVYDGAMDGTSIKRICEHLSWLEPADLAMGDRPIRLR